MTWNTLDNLSTAQLVTETHLDKLRENIEHVGAMTRLGTALSALAAGSKLNLLDGCLLRKTANQTISHNAATADYTWDAEGYDTNAFHSTSSSTELITIPVGTASGYALVYGIINFTVAASVTGYVNTLLYKNGSTHRLLYASFGNFPAGSVSYAPCIFAEKIAIAAGDTFKVGGAQVNSGASSASLLGGATNSIFGLARIE